MLKWPIRLYIVINLLRKLATVKTLKVGLTKGTSDAKSKDNHLLMSTNFHTTFFSLSVYLLSWFQCLCFSTLYKIFWFYRHEKCNFVATTNKVSHSLGCPRLGLGEYADGCHVWWRQLVGITLALLIFDLFICLSVCLSVYRESQCKEKRLPKCRSMQDFVFLPRFDVGL